MTEFTLRGKTVPELLRQLAENGNPEFTASLNPGVEHVLGCRLPDLRKLAREIVKSNDWELYLKTSGTFYMEERLLYGLVLGYIPLCMPFSVYLADYVDSFVERINCWTVCDAFTFAGGAGKLEPCKDELWNYLQGKLQSDKEYTLRFGVVMLMRYFTDDAHLERLFHLYGQISSRAYYVQMAVAWALSECFVRYPERTMAFLKQCRLDTSTFNKTLQKITESLRVDPAVKSEIREFKRLR